MILDDLQTLSDAQALTASAVSTFSLDMGNITPKNDPGAGEPMAAVFTIDVAADFTTGNETYQFNFVQDTAADLATALDVLMSRIITAANLTAGSIHSIPIPPGAVTKRYIGASYTLGGTTPTVTVTAMVMPLAMVDKYKAYAKGYTITG